MPDDVISIIRSLYSDFHITILTNSFSSDYIKIRKGVLQGDCFCPRIFDMVMNPLIQYIRNEFFQQLGYQFLKNFIPKHWRQFADDAAAITGQESENQTLLNDKIRNTQLHDKKHTTTWHKALSTLPTNIYSFVVCYLNITLANKT